MIIFMRINRVRKSIVFYRLVAPILHLIYRLGKVSVNIFGLGEVVIISLASSLMVSISGVI